VLINASHGLRKRRSAAVGPICCVALVLFWVSAIILFTTAPSFASQTREQCEKCCRGSIQDEYYQEQCRLKCFRNPNHCTDQKSRHEAREEDTSRSPAHRERVGRPAVTPRSAPPRVAGPTPGAPVMTGPPAEARRQPAQPPNGAHHRMTPRQASQRGLLVFPSPLNLVPGRESEAAGQILSLNGISPQHPNYRAGVQALTAILQNFARNNPAGGSLPTDEMQKVIVQLKQ
jgi:hypothetical protein